MKLNLGCGDSWMSKAINIDIRQLKPPRGFDFLRAQVEDLDHYFEPESVEEIWAMDVLEYVPQMLAKKVVASWAGLLQPRGILHLQVPNLQSLAKAVLDFKIPDEQAAWLIYGGQPHPLAFYKSGFTEKMVREILTDAGLWIYELEPVSKLRMYFRAVKESGDGAHDSR